MNDAEVQARTETLQRCAKDAAIELTNRIGVDAAFVVTFRDDLTYGVAINGPGIVLDDAIALVLEALVRLRRAAIAQVNEAPE